MRVRWTIFLLIATMSAFGVSLTIFLTEDKMILALISVVAVILTVMATVLVTCFFIEIKETENLQIQQRQCELAMRRNYECGLFATSRLHISSVGAQSSSTLPPMVMLPTVAGNMVDEFPIMIRAPPSYEESADLENTRVQSYSNAPPAYADSTNTNIASFSPPPFYRPALPEVQTATLYLSSESTSSLDSSMEERSVNDQSVTRVLSPLPRRMLARIPVHREPRNGSKPRRKRAATTITITPAEVRVSSVIPRIENGLSSSPSTSSSSSTTSETVMDETRSPTSSTSSIERPSLAQMFIDCSKAEPTLFTINRDESII
ncbi:unnamed protein product [Caenorhabditis angaria]|uniref:Uncharacterized protein n=1 Tax=Caenorhabditis angaria TaxID=860376 RepID=A0A9P1J3R2_9PELO|nr:unnamed protein product [Caenorhabditis angaria]